jgi:hypothetical protein
LEENKMGGKKFEKLELSRFHSKAKVEVLIEAFKCYTVV